MKQHVISCGRHSIGVWIDTIDGKAGFVTGYDNEPHVVIEVDVSTKRTRKKRDLFAQVQHALKEVL